MSGRFPLLSVVAISLLTSPTSSGQIADNRIDCVHGYAADAINYFREIALTAEGGGGFATPRRWQGEIRVELDPSLSEQDISWITQVIQRLTPMIRPVHLYRVESEPNFEIRSVQRRAFRQLVPGYRGNDRGLFWIDWNETGVIQSGGILVAEEVREPGLRRHIILEELVQALGLPSDSPRHSDSIFYSGESRVTQLSDLDEAVLRLLYDPSVSDEQRLFGLECPEIAQSAEVPCNDPSP